MRTKQAADEKSIDKRTIRAASESMRIDRHAGETDEFGVYSESGSVGLSASCRPVCFALPTPN